MGNEMESKLRELHGTFKQLTGLDSLKYNAHERMWYEFWKEGYTVEDLKVVLLWILKRNKKQDSQYRRVLRPSSVVGDIQRFDEDLALARAEDRNKRKAVTPKQRVLNQWQPIVGEDKYVGRTVSMKEALLNAIQSSGEDTAKEQEADPKKGRSS